MTRILVVEDDEKISKALNIRLSFDGYEVSRAFDAIAALNMLKEDQPDLVLLDISIPGGNGFEVISRAKKICGKVPAFFVITAHKDHGLREKAMALGAVGFFEKPFDGSELQTAIYRWLTTS
jgi:DNA-binding response OmpR family regulator